jgi:hypothetical protein
MTPSIVGNALAVKHFSIESGPSAKKIFEDTISHLDITPIGGMLALPNV